MVLKPILTEQTEAMIQMNQKSHYLQFQELQDGFFSHWKWLGVEFIFSTFLFACRRRLILIWALPSKISYFSVSARNRELHAGLLYWILSNLDFQHRCSPAYPYHRISNSPGANVSEDQGNGMRSFLFG
jgi:hypothetical protein